MVDYSDAQIEQEIRDKKLNAPRIRPDDLEDAIVNERYHFFQGTTVTVCLLELANGFKVVGESAAVSMENFDTEVGRKVARQKAKDKLWSLLGYALRERLYQQSQRSESTNGYLQNRRGPGR